MKNIRVDLDTPIYHGMEVVFRSPADCSQVTGLILYYQENGNTCSKEFAFADAHGYNVGDIDHLFAEDAVVKVILDMATSKAFVQNADTNAYLEQRFDDIEENISSVVCGVVGESITLSDASDKKLKGLTVYGKTTQAGTPTPDAPVALVSAGDSGSITVSVTDGTEENKQTVVVQTPNGIRGISVSSDGNYTDVTGQQWACDEIDLARGVYVHRAYLWTATDDMRIDSLGVLGSCCRAMISLGDKNGVRQGALCTHTRMSYSYTNDSPHFYLDGGYIMLFLPVSCGTTGAEVKAWMIENNLSVLYQLKEPYETELDEEILAAYTTPHTNKPNTTIYNDAGTGMKVSYVADTKAYIDNKFAELAAAIVNNT